MRASSKSPRAYYKLFQNLRLAGYTSRIVRSIYRVNEPDRAHFVTSTITSIWRQAPPQLCAIRGNDLPPATKRSFPEDFHSQTLSLGKRGANLIRSEDPGALAFFERIARTGPECPRVPRPEIQSAAGYGVRKDFPVEGSRISVPAGNPRTSMNPAFGAKGLVT